MTATILLFCPQLVYAYPDTISQHVSIKSVAIISAIGETFQFERVPDTAFEWLKPPELSFLEISDWGIDDFVMRAASATLSKQHKVVPVKYAEADFDTWTWHTLDRNLRELPPADDDVDAYIVILRDWRKDEIGGSTHDLGGLGFYRRDTSAAPKLGVYACYSVVVVDAHDYRVLATRHALSAVDALPWVGTQVSSWPATQNDMTGAEEAMLQHDEEKLISDTLASTLARVDPVRNPLVSKHGRSPFTWHRLFHKRAWRK